MLCSHPPTEFLTWLALEERAGVSECLAPRGMLSRTDGISTPSRCSAAQLSPAEPSLAPCWALAALAAPLLGLAMLGARALHAAAFPACCGIT